MSAAARVAVVTNPAAGRGRAGRVAPEVVRVLGEFADISVVDAGDTAASSLAALRYAADSAADAVVVCGGDGIVHLAANVLAGGAIPLGVVPAGSGDDIAAMLGFDPDPIRAARQLGRAVADRSTRLIDIGRCDGPQLVPGVDRVFVGLLYAGFDSAVNERANRLRLVPARARYNAALAVETLRLGTRPMRLSLDDEVLDVPVTLVAVGNGAQYGGGKRIAPRASWYDGLFEVTVIGPVSRLTLARLAPTLPRAGHVGHPAACFRSATRVGLAAPGRPDTVAYADGEPVGPLPIRAWVDPAALLVLVPVSGRAAVAGSAVAGLACGDGGLGGGRGVGVWRWRTRWRSRGWRRSR